jgi:hypothetical protein
MIPRFAMGFAIQETVAEIRPGKSVFVLLDTLMHFSSKYACMQLIMAFLLVTS